MPGSELKMRGSPTWKGYTESKHSCNNWNYSGAKQMKIYKNCKKYGFDPQEEFGKVMDAWLNKLSNGEERLEELRQKRDYLSTQIELIEKNNGGSVIVNEKLVKDIDEHISMIGEGSSYRWGYAIIRKLSNRYDMNFNDIIKVFNERVPAQIKNNEYKEKVLYFFRYVADRAKNGTLSDSEIDAQFPITAKVKV